MPQTVPGAAIVDSRTRGELTLLRLSGAQSSLEIAQQGAHLIAWALPGTQPVLFTSPHSVFQHGKAIRGGVPLVFPWFGPRAGAAQHGFARVRDWKLESALVESAGACKVALTLTDDELTRAEWPHAFHLRFAAIAGTNLRLALEVRNTGSAPFTFEAALHTYFAVSDVRDAKLHGLESAEYLDKADGGARKREENGPIVFTGETDRLYLDTDAACTIEDPGWRRRIVVAKSGSRSTVVWNPWTGKARAMADLGEDAWPGMLCVETTNAGDDARTLAPGDAHVIEATITVEPHDGAGNPGQTG